MKKKIFAFLLVLFITIVGTACNISTGEGGGITINPGGNGELNVDLDEVYLNIQSQITNKDNITSDITLPTKFGQVTITWTSDNPTVIDANGHIVRPEEDTTVILNCTLTNGTDSKSYRLQLTIKAKEPVVVVDEVSISVVLSGEVGKSYKTKGTVVAVCKTGFIIEDSTGLILSYLDTAYANDLVVGDVVAIEGTTSLYGGAVQFNKPTYEKIGNEQVTYPTPRKLDKDSYEALSTKDVKLEYVALRAKLAISGKYYNLAIDGSTVNGSICAPTGDVTEFDGKYVELTGYFVYVAGSSTKYVYFMTTDIKLSDDQGNGDTPTQLDYSTIAEVKAGNVGDKYKVKAVVVAVSSVSALVQDETGYILLYFGNDFRKDLAVGDEIEIEGTTSSYRDTVQFSSGKYEKVGTKAVSYPEPVVIDASSLDELVSATPVTKYVKVEGKLIKSGNYINLEVAGATAMGSVLSLNDLSEYDGKNVVVTGFYLYVTGSTTKYVYFIMTNIEESTTPVEHVVAKIDSEKQGTYTGDGVTVVITESKVTVTDPTGKVLEFVIYVEDDKYYVLEENKKVYCTFGEGTVTNNKGTFTKVVIETPVNTIEEVKAGTIGGNYKTKAVVVAVSNVSVLLQDSTGLILVYFGNTYAKDLVVSDEIELEGKTSTYNGTVQFSGGTYKKVGTKTVTYPEAEVLNASSLDALVSATPVTKYIKVEGKLVKSGNYINLEVEGAQNKGSIVTTIDVTEFDGKNVVVCGYYLYISGSSTKYVNFIATSIELSNNQQQPVLEPKTIEEIKAGTLGDTYKVNAVVVAASSVSVLLKDDTDYILVYFGSSFEKDLVVGDEIEFEGVTSSYKDTVQFSGGAYTKISSQTVTHPDAEELNGKMIDIIAGNNPVTTYVKVAGRLVISGNYVNLIVDGTEIQGSIVSPLEDLSDYNEKDVTVKGYYLYINGSSTRYFNIIMTDIELVETTVSDEEIVDEIIGEFNNLEFPAVYNNLILPTGGDGIEIAWISGNPEVLESNGTYHMPSAPTDVVFTITVSKGEVSKQTQVTFHVVGIETIASVLATTDFDNYHAVKGIVVAIGREGFVLQDSTGLISTSNGAFAQDVEVGDEVLVIGPVSTFGSLPQFSDYNLHYEKTGNKTTVSYPEPVVLDASSFEALFDSTESKYVQVTGSLEAGEYLSILTVEGTEVAGGLLHANLLEYDGMDVTIKGYFMYSVEGYKKFNEIFVTEIVDNGTANVDLRKVEKVMNDILLSLDGTTIYVPFTYESDYEDVTIEWRSSNSDIYEMGSVPLYKETASEITLTAVVSCGEESREVQVRVTIAPITPLAQVNSNDSEQWFVVKGQVIAETHESVLLKDDSGTIVIYFGSNSKPENLTVGNEIYYFGKVISYAGINEFNYGYYLVLDSSDVTYPEPAVLDGAGVDALVDTTETKYVKVTGDLEISGKYSNLYTKDGEYIVSLIAPIEELAEVNGERIVVTGYYVYTAGSTTKYPSIMMTGYELYEWSDEELVNEIKEALDSNQNVICLAGFSMTFPEGIEVTWASDHEEIISNDLAYNFPNEDTLVTLTATITKGEATATATMTFICKAPQTISSVLEAEDLSDRFLVKGTVVAVSQVSFLVKDETGLILAYYGTEFAQDLEVGDIVYLRGYITIYSGTRQFGKNVGYTKTGETVEVTYSEPITLDASSFDELLDSTEIKFVKLTATLHVSGNYYNLAVEGSSNNGSIVSPADANLSLADGATVSLTGYYLYTSGSATKYISFIATSLNYEVVSAGE